MQAPRFASVLGLGFGDCGKGLFVDFLCRQWQVHTVVRFNGGAQAGHNVVLADGRHHTFAQFGAGSFVAGVATVLAAPVVVHPTALLVEAAALARVGVPEALPGLLIDGRCRVTTPYHQAAGRLREVRRGAAAHGTCGVGVGETVGHALAHPEQALCYADLDQPRRALEKLAALRATLRAEFATDPALAAHPEFAPFADDGLAARWLTTAREAARQAPPATAERIAQRLAQPGTVLFEGAQGALLDEWRGFHPHTTWSRIHPDAVEAILADLGLAGEPVVHLGALRSYLTRHGQGPLPTADAALDSLAEPHNHAQGWQGQFRRGHPDGVLLRYARAALGRLDGLLVSHLDAFARGASLRWCEAYGLPNGELLHDLPLGPKHDLAFQEKLTATLWQASPVFAPGELSLPELLDRVAAAAGCDLCWGSFGPTAGGVHTLGGH